MKKLILIALAILAVACEEEKNPEPKDTLEFSSAKSFSFDNKGGEKTLSFTASGTWTSSTSASWISLSPSSGEGGAAKPVLSVTANTGTSVRNGFAVVKCGTVQDTVTVSQAAVDFLTVAPDYFNVGNAGGVYPSKVSANVDFNMQMNPSSASGWISAELGQADSRGERTLMITVARNDDVHGRDARIEFVSASLSAEIGIAQGGQTPTFSVTASDVKIPAAGKTFSVPVTTNLEVTASTPSWVTATRTAEGFDFVVSENTGDDLRSGTVTISNAEFSKSVSFKVSQKSPKSIYILAIGNSFSVDAMEYLYGVLKDLGYKDIFLGNLYIGGCTLATHANNIKTNAGAYQYYTNSTGSWSSTNGFNANDAMKERDWDYVSMQQASGYSGVPDSYDPYLSNIVDAVKKNCPDAKRMWHMTWAYQGNSSHSDFAKYGKNQMTMYEAILNCVRTKVVASGNFEFVIPCGTAVQNLRTSFMGDNITRDGYHMSYKEGRYVTALMWARQISGKSIASVTYKPSSYSYSQEDLLAIKEAVENAYKTPMAVTASSYPGFKVIDSDVPAEVLSGNGLDIGNYTELALSITHYAYYNSTNNSNLVSKAGGSTATNLSQFSATQIFEKSALPNGSLIVLKRGFQYRPEAWTSLSAKTTARPGNVTTQLVEVTDSWWGSWNFRAFNIAKAGNPALDDAGQAELDDCLHIYIPK